MYLMNSPADTNSVNFEDLDLEPMEADLDLFDFDFSDDVFEIEGSSDGPDDMDVQMEDSTQPETETDPQHNHQRSLCCSFQCDASQASGASQASFHQYSEADLYNGALEKLAESMKRTEESRRYVLKIQREVLTESQKKVLSSLRDNHAARHCFQ